MVWTEGHENSSEIVMMHRHQQSVLSRSKQRRRYVELPPEMWSERDSEYWRLSVSLYGACDAAANSEDAYAKVLQEHQFERGVVCPCAFYSRERDLDCCPWR